MTTPPSTPSQPPAVHHQSSPVGTTKDDWWDRLYTDQDQAPTEEPAPRRFTVSADRLPAWWADKPEHLTVETEEEEAREDTDEDPATTGSDVADDEPDAEDVAPAPASKAPAAGSFWRGWAPAGAIGMTPLHPTRGRRVLYNASAAALGWGLGAARPLEDLIEACGREYGRTGAVVAGGAVVLAVGVLIDHRTRGWWPPLAWMCRVPLATAALALLLAQF